MNGVTLAFFSQLAYLNWNKLNNSDVEFFKKGNKNFIENLNLFLDKIKTSWYDDPQNLPELKETRAGYQYLLYKEEDKRIFGVYSEEEPSEKNLVPIPKYDFTGWEFVYGATEKELLRDMYKIKVSEDEQSLWETIIYSKKLKSEGFFGCSFMKENILVIAFRGTEPTDISDLVTDSKLGFFNETDTQLIYTYLYYIYMKRKYPSADIYITGHSLGGALAQYAYITSGKKYNTVTWNGLGIGKHKYCLKNKKLYISSIETPLDLIKSILSLPLSLVEYIFNDSDIGEYGLYNKEAIANNIREVYIVNNDISGEISKDEDSHINKIRSIIARNHEQLAETGFTELTRTDIGDFKIKLGIGNMNREKNYLTSDQRKDIYEKALLPAIKIYWLLRATKAYKDNYLKENTKIKNYYNKKDWTANLQTREGKIIEVITGKEIPEEKTDDSKERVLRETFDKIGFTYHGVNDFLLYMNKSGNIEPGKLSNNFFSNSVKTIYKNISNETKNKDLRIEGDKLYKEDAFKNFKIYMNRPRFKGKIKSPMELCEFSYEEFLLKEVNGKSNGFSLKLDKEFKYKIKNQYVSIEEAKEKIIGEYIIGSFNNLNELCGILGGEPEKVYQYRDEKSVEQMKKFKDYEEDMDQAKARAAEKRNREVNKKTYTVVTDKGGKLIYSKM